MLYAVDPTQLYRGVLCHGAPHHQRGGAGVGDAFTSGLRNAYLTMMGLLLVSMAVSVLTVNPEPSRVGGQAEEAPAS